MKTQLFNFITYQIHCENDLNLQGAFKFRKPKSSWLTPLSVGIMLLFMMSFKTNAQTCVSEKLTVRMVSFNYSGTDVGGPDIRVIGTANIGATTGTSACFGADNVTTLPLVPQPDFIVSAPVTCGATLSAITVSYKAHEDNAAISNCNV
jgi:hypothetical protein